LSNHQQGNRIRERLLQHPATPRNGCQRIVALERLSRSLRACAVDPAALSLPVEDAGARTKALGLPAVAPQVGRYASIRYGVCLPALWRCSPWVNHPHTTDAAQYS
jgi:hypothetical protein